MSGAAEVDLAVIGSGAEPARPQLPGLDRVDYLTSTTAMEQTRLPDSLVIVGGGYVGIEQAQLFAHLGVHVSVVGRLAPRTEPEVADVLREVFAADGITRVEDRAVQVESDTDQVTVLTRSGQRASGQRLLVATGRFPRTADLGLEPAKVDTDAQGFVTVDEQQRTSNPASSPPEMSPGHPTTSMWPPRPGGSPPPTRWPPTGSTPPESTIAACPRSSSPAHSSPPPG